MLEHARTQNAGHLPATSMFHHVALQSNSVVKTSIAYFTLVKVDPLVNLQVLSHVAQANAFPTDATWGRILASSQSWNVLEHAQMYICHNNLYNGLDIHIHVLEAMKVGCNGKKYQKVHTTQDYTM